MPKDDKANLRDSVLCGIWGIAILILTFLFRDPMTIFAGVCASLFFLGSAALMFFIFLRDRAFRKSLEFAGIVGQCRYHPDIDIEDVVRETVSGAKYWTFKTAWKKLRNSHDFGRVFTTVYR